MYRYLDAGISWGHESERVQQYHTRANQPWISIHTSPHFLKIKTKTYQLSHKAASTLHTNQLLPKRPFL